MMNWRVKFVRGYVFNNTASNAVSNFLTEKFNFLELYFAS